MSSREKDRKRGGGKGCYRYEEGEREREMKAMCVAVVAVGCGLRRSSVLVAITIEGCADRWSSDVTGRGMLRRHGDRQRTRPPSLSLRESI